MKNICNTRKNGLSPLARGARHSQADPATALRFIPAGAGNTPASSVYSARSPVYPRWRGELMLLFVASGSDCGLSPLARGTQPLFKNLVPFYRFIPAGAGHSLNEALDCRKHAVYPRWRGELILFAAESLCRYGLSPLARGTPPIFPYRRVAERFIPAGAGNSLNITYY